MGAKQSKRSVDISGKEAEGGGEVAAAGAGGEGRMEPLADADALKPQLNGDAHIQHEQTDKEKELDSGTPENEKDATTEKEAKEEDEKEKEAVAVTNGDTEPKVENGEPTPTPEDGKKPKKEKVKKKWSLRSISFSRKDKPKQEKKQKDEEPKTNGEPEKVPEETAETTTEAAANEIAEEAKPSVEQKEEKTPETPVTEPLTNGTSTPDSVKAETPASEEAAPAPSLEADRPAEVKPDPTPEPQHEPEQLPVNGLSLEEPKPETPEVVKPEETKPEPPVAETAEIVPAPEIPKEVCVEQLPLLEPTPPPLPANPPPSSVASFAATTMAPELTDASLANTADAAIAPLSALSETKDILVQSELPTAVAITETLENELPSILKETNEEIPAVAINNEPEIKENLCEKPIVTDVNVLEKVNILPESDIAIVAKDASELIDIAISEIPETKVETVVMETSDTIVEPSQAAPPEIETVKCEPLLIETVNAPEVPVVIEISETKPSEIETTAIETINIDESNNKIETETITQAVAESVITESELEIDNLPEPEVDISEGDDSSLPPPPLQDEDDCVTNLDDVDQKVEESLKQIPEPITETNVNIESNHISNNEMTNGVHNISPDETVDTEMLKKKAKAAPGSSAETVECDGPDEKQKQTCEEAPQRNGSARPEPAPPAAAPLTPQEPLPVSDKIADLIPEVPDVPELKTETLQETVTDVAVAN